MKLPDTEIQDETDSKDLPGVKLILLGDSAVGKESRAFYRSIFFSK